MADAKTAVLVGRRSGLHQPDAFVPFGVFTGTDAKKKAEALCTDEWCFCLKIELNKKLKCVDMPWAETWNPVTDKK